MPKPIAAYAVGKLEDDGKIRIIKKFVTLKEANEVVRAVRADPALTHAQRMAYIMTPLYKGEPLLPPGDLPSINRTNADDMKK
jgi:hypothetical protein